MTTIAATLDVTVVADTVVAIIFADTVVPTKFAFNVVAFNVVALTVVVLTLPSVARPVAVIVPGVLLVYTDVLPRITDVVFAENPFVVALTTPTRTDPVAFTTDTPEELTTTLPAATTLAFDA